MKKEQFVLNSFLDFDLRPLSDFPIIVIYEKPLDYPQKYVARLFDLQKATQFVVIKDSLEEIRSIIPQTMHRIPRCYSDDPVIVESYL